MKPEQDRTNLTAEQAKPNEEEFKLDIKLGLKAPKKYISSKYLYDERGGELFNQITKNNEYYITNMELAILQENKHNIMRAIGNSAINLVDLGPGEGIKTDILINECLQQDRRFFYVPIDINEKYLQLLSARLQTQACDLKIISIHADFFKGLEWICKNSEHPNLVLFLGSSIGNFDPVATRKFLKHVHDTLRHGDYFLIGFDLCKDINLLMRAYDDSQGITRDFNLNLLHRLNRELKANFDVSKFQHYATYNVYTKAMESYLISLEAQKIHIDSIEDSFKFDAIEPIHTEFSYKYKLTDTQKLAQQTGFKVIENYFDKSFHFLDSLWRVNKK